MAKRQLRMIRPELTTLPPLRIPRSYGLRTYQVGDDQHWAEIINNSFGGERTTEDVRREIMDQDIFNPEGLDGMIQRPFLTLHKKCHVAVCDGCP